MSVMQRLIEIWETLHIWSDKLSLMPWMFLTVVGITLIVGLVAAVVLGLGYAAYGAYCVVAACLHAVSDLHSQAW